MRALAIALSIVSFLSSVLPNAVRCLIRWTIACNAVSACPIERIQWWMRPGPSRPWAISNPLPSPSSMFDTGTRTSLKMISAWSCWWPKTARGRRIVMPGVSRGTSTILCLWWTGPSARDLPRKTNSLHSGRHAPLIYHLCPLMTYSSPCLLIDAEIFVASLLATPGSVIAKAERMVPSNSGDSHRAFCSSVPYFCRTSMLPVSGAEQFIAKFAAGQVPRISWIGEYSRTLRPHTSGRKKLNKPLDFAFSMSVQCSCGIGAYTGCSTVLHNSWCCL
mmetsp:Transcript_16871/g.32936  ORF Transcript_16871/g.32936 Transcript_16871/m.32936 type:complete len:276 (-) Transcript_16871:161-988(-)